MGQEKAAEKRHRAPVESLESAVFGTQKASRSLVRGWLSSITLGSFLLYHSTHCSK